jgi:hypothetical protein
MLYSILIFGSEEHIAQWTSEQEKEVMKRHAALRRDLEAEGRLGPVLRLTPHSSKTVRRYKERDHITDGPFIESKEHLMGLYVVDCATFEDAVTCAKRLSFDTSAFQIAELSWLTPGGVRPLMPDDRS